MADVPPAADKLRLGGMALANGLLVHGPTHWAAAIRTKSGDIEVASGRKPRVPGPVEKLPGARGVIRMGESMLVIPLVMRALPAARLPFQNLTVMAAAGGAALAGSQLRRRNQGIGGEAMAAAISLVPSLVALRGGDTAAYHGVEHKAIGAYEQGADDAREATKEHDRCGSHLIAPLMAANLLGVALLRKLPGKHHPAAGSLVSLTSLGVAVEVFLWSERNSGTFAARALRKPGHELQRLLGTREPSERQLEVGRAALAEILAAEGVAA
ncbi:MAG TPA: DUF1385 domain-containing protein [Baekduia sp.]|nr:DUF1385 domain-containing protein [Baekduia sp.]